MSQSSLFAFLLQLDAEMERTSSEYRQEKANKRTHPFNFDKDDLVKQTIYELESRSYKVTSDDRAVMVTAADKMLSNLKATLKPFSKTAMYYKESATGVSMVFTSSVGIKSKFGAPDDVFASVKATYGPSLRTYFNDLQEHFKSTKEVNPKTNRERSRVIRTARGNELKSPGRFFNAGHAEGEGVFESMLADAFTAAAGSVVDDAGNSIGEAAVLRDLDKLGVDLSIMRDTATDSHTISLESQSFNKKYGGLSAAKKRVLQEQLFRALKIISGNFADFYDLEGSDTPRQRNRKKAIKKAIEPFQKIKGVTIKLDEDIKLAPPKKTKSNKRKASSTLKGKRFEMAAPVIVASRKRSKPAKLHGGEKPFINLMALINQKLPQTVAKNMGEPRLVNRTGRFASSARVTDITSTKQGFPSIGYTYEKNPYSVFERTSGTRFASVERDPRDLIEGSVREIASQMLVGRFYTRRV